MWAVLPLLCAGAWLLGAPACGAAELAANSLGTGTPGTGTRRPRRGAGRSETLENLGGSGLCAWEEPGSARRRPEALGLCGSRPESWKGGLCDAWGVWAREGGGLEGERLAGPEERMDRCPGRSGALIGNAPARG